MWLKPKIDQGIERLVALKVDAAAISTIATIRSAHLDVFFSAET